MGPLKKVRKVYDFLIKRKDATRRIPYARRRFTYDPTRGELNKLKYELAENRIPRLFFTTEQQGMIDRWVLMGNIQI
jgi:hypothetical protein